MTAAISDKKPSLDERCPVPHLQETYNTWKNLQNLIKQGHLVLDGHSVDAAAVVAVARFVNTLSIPSKDTIYLTKSRHECVPMLEQNGSVIKAVEDSVNTLQEYLSKGYFVYGHILCQNCDKGGSSR